MLFFDSSGRAIRSVGLLVAAAASLATSPASSTVSGSVDLVVDATGPGATTEYPLELSVQGHPELTQNEVRLGLELVEPATSVRGRFEIEEVATGTRITFVESIDAGPDELRAGWLRAYRLLLGEPLCADPAGCTRRLILRVTDLDTAARLRVDAAIFVSRDSPPPGDVTLREVAP